ncbi:hypothetical protein [Alkaliphilus oremlandii]|uniref:Uncharacterized protein n=1 Tax=Alkaliphilus oremlandii (strain OhILAs) TaxID=350688 RepID=A8MGX7_ALKOO|nr:hypothetical protein [Alkaliphilus oremlandii]ABW18671.1 hypothetical protein Clos_1125 [Alkaliphilus oremlandii OhILAs]
MLVTQEDLLLFIYIYVFSFLGAFSKDMLDTFLEKIPKVLIFKVLTSSLAVTILLYGASEYLLNKISYKPFTAICYIFGIISFELMVRYSNIKNIKTFINYMYRIKKDIDKG